MRLLVFVKKKIYKYEGEEIGFIWEERLSKILHWINEVMLL